MLKNDLSYYRRLPYRRRVELRKDADGSAYFLAWIEEIPFIRVEGPTREDALGNLGELFDDCIEAMIRQGDEIAEPLLWPEGYGTVDGAKQIRLPLNMPENQSAAPGTEFPSQPDPWTVLREGSLELSTV